MSTRYVSKEVYERMETIRDVLKDILQEHGGEVAWYSVQSNTSKERYRVQGVHDVEHSRFITSICVVDGQCVVHDILPELEVFWDEDDAIPLCSIQAKIKRICDENISKDMTEEGDFVMSTDKGSSILIYKGKMIQHCSSEEMKAFIDNLVELDDDRREAEDE